MTLYRRDESTRELPVFRHTNKFVVVVVVVCFLDRFGQPSLYFS